MNREKLDIEWLTFVSRHRCMTNLFYHSLSVFLFWSGPILFLVTWNWYYWILFFMSGGAGGIGHVVGTDPGINVRELAFSPAAAFMASYMVYRVATGKYHLDIARAEEYAPRADD